MTPRTTKMRHTCTYWCRFIGKSTFKSFREKKIVYEITPVGFGKLGFIRNTYCYITVIYVHLYNLFCL